MTKQELEQIIDIVTAQVRHLMRGYTKTQRAMVTFELECMRQYTGDGQTLSHITFREFLRRLKLFTDKYTEETIEIIHKLNNLDLTNIFDTYADLNIYYQSALAQYQQDIAEYEAAIAENPDSDLQLPTLSIHKDYLYVVLHDESTDNLINIYRFDGENLINVTQPVKPHKHVCLYYPDGNGGISEQKCVEADGEGNIFFYNEQGTLTADYNYTEPGKWTFDVNEEDNYHDGIRYVEPAGRDSDVDAIFALTNKIVPVIGGDEIKPADEPDTPIVVTDGDGEVVEQAQSLGMMNMFGQEGEEDLINDIQYQQVYSVNPNLKKIADKLYSGDILLNSYDNIHYRFLGYLEELGRLYWAVNMREYDNTTEKRTNIIENVGKNFDATHKYVYQSVDGVPPSIIDFCPLVDATHLECVVGRFSDGELWVEVGNVSYHLRKSLVSAAAAEATYKMELDVRPYRSLSASKDSRLIVKTTIAPEGIKSGETCYDTKSRKVYEYKGYVSDSEIYLWYIKGEK